MQLVHRPAIWTDLEACAGTLMPCYGPNQEIFRRLPGLWRDLCASGCMVSSVVEDTDRPMNDRIVAIGSSVFVTANFMEALKTEGPAYMAAEIALAFFAGSPAMLDREAIRRENARDGLNLCVLHYGFPGVPFHVLPHPLVHEKHLSAFFHYHPGLHIREFVREVQGETWLRFMRNAGARLRTDYGAFYQNHPGGRPRPEHRPYLVGLSEVEAREAEGARLYPMFLPETPRFGFTPGQRELLQRALAGETDEELAESLCVSLSAVKKRWFSIYDRVATVDPGLLPEDAESRASLGRRGEKRRYLLNHLRDHPAELFSPA